ncbi:MAG: rhodanese-like domain-containing protein, partial [Candidatus Neomarinimicrobiota bacterium]
IPGVRSIIELQQTKLFRPELYDKLIEVSTPEAFDMCLRINREESIIAGPSSGLALAGALKVIQDDEDAVVVVIFPDNAFKYASSFQRHFPEMFENMVGSPAQSDIINEKEELLNKMIELCRNDVNTIGLNDAYNIRSETNPIFIDVRSSDQYSATHIVDAINIPINNLLLGNNKLPKDKDYPIVTVCNVGNDSIEGLLILKSLGYSNVKSLNEGTTGWIVKGFPIVKK